MGISQILKVNKTSIILILVSVCIGGSVAYYVQSHYSSITDVYTLYRLATNLGILQPSQNYDVEGLLRDYNETVEVPENKYELATARQIIEWCVINQEPPWGGDLSRIFHKIPAYIGEITLHVVFINTTEGDAPVMTVTYNSATKLLTFMKGWREQFTNNSFTGIVTEQLAISCLQCTNIDQLVQLIEQNSEAIRLIRE